MKCLNLNISRITNGCIEKHFATIKKSVGLNNMPVDYINKTIKLALGYAIKYDDLTETEPEPEIEHENIAEQDIYSCEDKWGDDKKVAPKRTFEGYYQKCSIFKLKEPCVKKAKTKKMSAKNVKACKMAKSTKLKPTVANDDISILDPQDKDLSLFCQQIESIMQNDIEPSTSTQFKDSLINIDFSYKNKENIISHAEIPSGSKITISRKPRKI